MLQCIGNWLYNWQTLIGSLLATVAAVGAAAIAWRAAIKQIASVQAEQKRREDYATSIAGTYLSGVKEILRRVKIEQKKLNQITEEDWRKNPRLAPSILGAAQMIFVEPNRRPRMGDVETYRPELPVYLSGDIILVIRLERDLDALVVELLGQQNVACSFPIQDCQSRLNEAVKKLDEAVATAESSFERFKYE